jgi:hypothetical protein
MNFNKTRLFLSAIYFLCIVIMLLQSCTPAKETAPDKLLGSWVSVNGGPDVKIFREGDACKVTVFKRSGITRRLKPETFLLKEEAGNLFISTGFRIDITYNGATDILTISSHGDYTRTGTKQ